MEKKRDIGIIIVGIAAILIGISRILFNVVLRAVATAPSSTLLLWQIIPIAFSSVAIVCGIFIIKLKNWARILFMCQLLLLIFGSMYMIFLEQIRHTVFYNIHVMKTALVMGIPPFIPGWVVVCFHLILLIFLIHPKVKEQFQS